MNSLTISCNGENKVCVAKSLCVDGYVHPLKRGFIRSGQVKQSLVFFVTTNDVILHSRDFNVHLELERFRLSDLLYIFTQVQECKLSHEACCTVQYDNSPYGNDRINTMPKDHRYPEPTLENDEKYVPYGENNQADVTELKPPLEDNAVLQSPSDNGYEIEAADQSRDTRPAEEVPIDYNQIPADTNRQEQYQTGAQRFLLRYLFFIISR